MADLDYKQASMPKGSAKALNDASAEMDDTVTGTPLVAAPVAQPETEGMDMLAPELDDDLGDIDSEEEAMIVGPTDEPDEPATAGMSFGPGAGESLLPSETPRQFLLRLAQKVSTMPEADPEAKLWALRHLANE